MKIYCDRDALIAAVSPICAVASGRNTIPALDCILIRTQEDNTCLFVGYDLEKGIKISLPCGIDQPGFFLLNAARFLQIIKAMPAGEVTVEINDKTCRTKISGGASLFELQAQPGASYPDLPEIVSNKGFCIKTDELGEIFRKTSFAAAVSDPRPYFNGVFMKIAGNRITAVGCDGSRMSLVETTSELTALEGNEDVPDYHFILPVRTIDELSHLMNGEESVTMRLGRKHILFQVGSFEMFARLIDAEYVEYERFIPKESTLTVTLDRVLFQMSLERALLVTEDKQPGQSKSPVICKFTDGILNVSAVSITGSANDDIEIGQEGENVNIAFNCRYLCDAIRAADSEKLKLSLTDSLSGMIIEPTEPEADKRFLMLILPVRG